MDEEYFKKLYQRYKTAKREEKNVFFELEEILFMLQYIEYEKDWKHYDKILVLGLQLYPNNEELIICKGKWYFSNFEYEKALQTVETLQIHNNMNLDLLRIDCYTSLHNLKHAANIVDSLSKTDCDYLDEAILTLSEAYSNHDCINKAIELLKLGLKRYPDDKEMLALFIDQYLKNNNYKEAIHEVNELTSLSPYNTTIWTALGRLYLENREYDQAVKAFDMGLTCDESNNVCKILRGYALYMNESYVAAIEAYQNLLSEIEEKRYILDVLSDCYLFTKFYDDGFKIMLKLYEQYTKHCSSHFIKNMVKCSFEVGFYYEAFKFSVIGYHKSSSKKYFRDMIVRLKYKFLKNATQEEYQAIIQLSKELEYNIDIENNFLEIGTMFHMMGDMETAIPYYNDLLKHDPKEKSAYIQRALAYLTLGSKKKYSENIGKGYLNPKSVNKICKSLKHKESKAIANRRIFNNVFLKTENIANKLITDKKSYN